MQGGPGTSSSFPAQNDARGEGVQGSNSQLKTLARALPDRCHRKLTWERKAMAPSNRTAREQAQPEFW